MTTILIRCSEGLPYYRGMTILAVNMLGSCYFRGLAAPQSTPGSELMVNKENKQLQLCVSKLVYDQSVKGLNMVKLFLCHIYFHRSNEMAF